MSKRTRIEIQISEDEKKEVQKMAIDLGLTTSELIRKCIMENKGNQGKVLKAQREIRDFENRIYKEFVAQGRNMNQVLREYYALKKQTLPNDVLEEKMKNVVSKYHTCEANHKELLENLKLLREVIADGSSENNA